jgi:hypothetical protein
VFLDEPTEGRPDLKKEPDPINELSQKASRYLLLPITLTIILQQDNDDRSWQNNCRREAKELKTKYLAKTILEIEAIRSMTQ